MRFSIVIAAYNQQDTLADAIESALNQTVQAEVIVVNDGSPDYTKEIAEKYKVHPEFCFNCKEHFMRCICNRNSSFRLVNQVNKGLASARNAGIMNMTGDILFLLKSLTFSRL